MTLTLIKCNNAGRYRRPELLSLVQVRGQGWPAQPDSSDKSDRPDRSDRSDMSDRSDKSDIKSKFPGSNPEHHNGFILIAVLWITLLLSIFALNTATTSRLQGVQAMHVQERLLVDQALLSALEIGFHEYQKYLDNRGLLENRAEWEASTGKELELWFPRFEPYFIEVEGIEVGVRILNAGGKLDINNADVHLLQTIAEVCGASAGTESSSIANSILDWIDEDDLRRADGAETDYYMSLPDPYLPKNNMIQDIRELLLVKGVTRDIFYGSEDHPGLVHFFSVRGSGERMDINSADPETFSIIGELSAAVIQDIVDKRNDKPISNLADIGELIPYGYFDELQRYYVVTGAEQIEIQAFKTLDDGSQGRTISRLFE